MLDGNARSLTCVRMGPDVSDLVFKGKMDTPSRKKNDSGCFLGLVDLLQGLLVTVLRIGVECLHIIMLVQWSYVMTSTHLAMLQATKRPRYGFFESVLRKVLLPLPFFWVIVWSWQFEIAAVWWIISGTNVFMTVITVVYAQWVLRHLGKTKLVV